MHSIYPPFFPPTIKLSLHQTQAVAAVPMYHHPVDTQPCFHWEFATSAILSGKFIFLNSQFPSLITSLSFCSPSGCLYAR
jgi:hypothetical protein